MVLAILTLLPMTAAKAEVTECKVITALPAEINSSGVWCLKQDLAWNGVNPAIHIQRSFVTLDLNGYTIKGPSGGMGIFGYDLNNVTIRNGTIFGFRQGIVLVHSGTTGANIKSGRHLIESMTIEKSGLTGIDVSGDSNIVRGNHVVRTRSTTEPGHRGISVQSARNTVVSGNTVSGTTGIGIQVFNSQMIEVRSNSVFDTRKNGQTAWGIWVTANSSAVTVEGNRIANASGGTNGILANYNAAMISCINNVVVGYATAFVGCNFEFGNLTP
jgi:parallel beta-helix repeat protein